MFFQVASILFYDMNVKLCISFNIVGLMMEINSFFLHSRKLLRMTNFPFDHWFYRTVVYLNLVTFLIFRGYPSVRITYALFMEYHHVPRLYLYGMYACMFVLNGIYPVLFWRLLKSDVLRQWNRKPDSKIHSEQNGYKSPIL